ncbi:unconventional prefoldin RPB5 interactor-like protein [Toxorhynchites rutilus septentrionalis]|uniref:unconventional prefoldin RPB5 interactor-like protein n=1 Tax=Toxorhynchites rutilus septentrionalis TaxID=329112 RepID=UPI00247A4799|nr:unconventional prefoldin RPB5 interactor-like protein [Toxorhynchites rutilus septentrionalis]
MEAMNLYQKAYCDALTVNSQETERWNAYRKEHQNVKEHLSMYQKQLKVQILIPIGSKAFLPGHLYHTGEVMASHGCGYFSDCSTEEANLLIDHRIAVAEKMLQRYDNERELFTSKMEVPYAEEAFGGQEIIEKYDEEREKLWREEHRIRTRKHKQQEAEKRLENQNENASDADIFDRLEELELMEELEQEIRSLEVPIDNDDQLRRLMDGEIKVNERKILAHDATAKADSTYRTVSEIKTETEEDKPEHYDIEVSTTDDGTSSSEESDDDISSSFSKLLQETKAMNKKDKAQAFRKKLHEIKTRLQEDDTIVAEKVDLCDLRYEIEEALDFMEPSWETLDDSSSIENETSKKKTITFAKTKSVKIIDKWEAASKASDHLEDSGRRNTLELRVVHSLAAQTQLDANKTGEIRSPADIYRVFQHCLRKDDTETPLMETKSILKNRDMVLAETHHTVAEPIAHKNKRPQKAAPVCYTIGDVIEHKFDDFAKPVCNTQAIPSVGQKKVSKFKQQRH